MLEIWRVAAICRDLDWGPGCAVLVSMSFEAFPVFSTSTPAPTNASTGWRATRPLDPASVSNRPSFSVVSAAHPLGCRVKLHGLSIAQAFPLLLLSPTLNGGGSASASDPPKIEFFLFPSSPPFTDKTIPPSSSCNRPDLRHWWMTSLMAESMSTNPLVEHPVVSSWRRVSTTCLGDERIGGESKKKMR